MNVLSLFTKFAWRKVEFIVTLVVIMLLSIYKRVKRNSRKKIKYPCNTFRLIDSAIKIKRTYY